MHNYDINNFALLVVAVFESLRTVLHEARIDKRVQYMIEVMFAIRKDGFKVRTSDSAQVSFLLLV